MFKSVVSSCNLKIRTQFFPYVLQRSILSASPKPCNYWYGDKKNFSSKVASTLMEEPGLFKNFIKKARWFDHARTHLKLSGYYLYESIADNIMFTEWFEECEIEDTFSSWFAITELHVWMMMVRMMAEDVNKVGHGERYTKDGDGRHVRNCIVEALWADVGNRIKALEHESVVIPRKQVVELSEQFQATLISYDEGMHDDRILAAAIWRRIFNMDLVDAEHVEKVVKLVRKQMKELDNIPWEVLIKQPKINWIQLKRV